MIVNAAKHEAGDDECKGMSRSCHTGPLEDHDVADALVRSGVPAQWQSNHKSLLQTRRWFKFWTINRIQSLRRNSIQVMGSRSIVEELNRSIHHSHKLWRGLEVRKACSCGPAYWNWDQFKYRNCNVRSAQVFDSEIKLNICVYLNIYKQPIWNSDDSKGARPWSCAWGLAVWTLDVSTLECIAHR